MFKGISWSTYWMIVGILSLAYYLGVYLYYFRDNFSIQWTKKAKGLAGEIRIGSADDGHDLIDSEISEEDYISCRQEIDSFLEQGNLERKSRDEMIVVTTRIIQKYPALPTSKYGHELESFIRAAFDKYCNIHLDEEEIARVW